MYKTPVCASTKSYIYYIDLGYISNYDELPVDFETHD